MFQDDTIAGSWSALARRIDSTNALGRWAAEDDRLEGLDDVARDLVPLLARGADPGRADDVLGALVRQSAIDGGADDDALLLTMHLMSDWVVPLAAQLRDLNPGMIGVIVGELTCQIRTYQWRTRIRAVAATLRWDTRRAVLSQFRPSTPGHRYRAELLLEPSRWELAASLGQFFSGADGGDIDLGDFLLWAVGAGVGEVDIALLIRTEEARADATVKASDDVVAAELGLPRRTFYRHRARALDAVRAASREYSAAVA